MEINNNCALAHNKFQENLKGAQDFVDEAKALFQFCKKWTGATKNHQR